MTLPFLFIHPRDLDEQHTLIQRAGEEWETLYWKTYAQTELDAILVKSSSFQTYAVSIEGFDIAWEMPIYVFDEGTGQGVWQNGFPIAYWRAKAQEKLYTLPELTYQIPHEYYETVHGATVITHLVEGGTLATGNNAFIEAYQHLKAHQEARVLRQELTRKNNLAYTWVNQTATIEELKLMVDKVNGIDNSFMLPFLPATQETPAEPAPEETT